MTKKTDRELAQKSIAENRKAFHDYHLLESFEAGIVLLGTEVKAIREGRVNLRDSFARLADGGQASPRRARQPPRQLRPARGRRGVPLQRQHQPLQPPRLRRSRTAAP